MKTTIVNTYVGEELKTANNFVDLYNEATEDYEFWSKDFNMHFGYYIISAEK